MKRLLRSACLAAVFAAVLAVPSQAPCWGSATHAYIMKQLSGNQASPLALYGAMAPDTFNIMVDSDDYGVLSDETHYHSMKVRFPAGRKDLRPFSMGFLSHNERWGADYSAHVRYGRMRTGYIKAKSITLGRKVQPVLRDFFEEAGIPNAALWANFAAPLLSHPLLETAIDLLVQQELDPSIGTDIVDACSGRPESVPDLLVKAYRKALSDRLDMSLEEAEGLIRDTEQRFRATMFDYGHVLAWERSAAEEELARQGAVLAQQYFKSASGIEIEVPPAMLIGFLELANAAVAGDYREALRWTIKRMLPFYGRMPVF